MIKNISSIDRILRIVVAIAILGLYLANVITGTLAIILLVVAIAFIVTSMLSYCPMYQILGIKRWTKKS